MNKELLNKAEQFLQKNLEKKSSFFDPELRKNALLLLSEEGFPTKKNEEWKYTNVNFINTTDFHFPDNKTDVELTVNDIQNFIINSNDEYLLVFVNGYFNRSLSRLNLDGNDNIIIGQLEDALSFNKNYHTFIGSSLDKLNDGFTLLNSSLFCDGAFVLIPENTVLEKPIHILNIADSRHNSYISNQRNIVLAGCNSNVTILESNYQIGDCNSFYNVITEIFADDSSVIDYYKLQNEDKQMHYIGTTQVVQYSNSIFNSTTISLNQKFARNNLNSLINGEFCESNFNGLYFLTEDNFVDNHTLADHASPNSNSNEVYRGIIDGESTAVFNGKIIVRPDAQKTNAYQSNKNILLSDDATINTKPQLEIYADDVKCSHGATSGTINNESLFYLRARGISEETAKALLLYAFADEIIEKIKLKDLKDKIKNNIAEKLNIVQFINDEIQFD